MDQKTITLLVLAATACVNIVLFAVGFTGSLVCTVSTGVQSAYAAIAGTEP